MQSVFRAAENGLALVRATRSGLSLIVDPAGRVVASASDDGRGEVLLVAEVPIARGGTFFTAWGPWAVGMSGLILAATVAGARRRSA